jgi:hypothetical protein
MTFVKFVDAIISLQAHCSKTTRRFVFFKQNIKNFSFDIIKNISSTQCLRFLYTFSKLNLIQLKGLEIVRHG